MMITALPKSASASISYLLAEHLDCPVARCSFPGYMHATVVPGWATELGRGGAVTHEHFPASDQNLAALARAGVTKIVVQVRDPRQAFLSFIHHLARHKHSPTVGDLLDFDFDAAAAESLQVLYVAMIDWIQAWVAISERPNALKLHFLRYDAFVADKPRCVEDLLSFFGVSGNEDVLENRIRKKETSGDWLNLRVADPEEWRRSFSPETQRILSTLLPDNLINRFSWDAA